MVKVYANPGLLPMFNLWQEQTGESLLPISRFIQALDAGSPWLDDNMWSVLDDYYGDNSDYNWWKNGSRPYMTIAGLDTTFGRRENIQEKLGARINGNQDWDEPLFEVEVVEPYETMQNISQMSSARRARYDARIRNTPDALRNVFNLPVLPIYTQGNYVTLVSLGTSEYGEAWFNSIYFTLRPGEAWPKPKPRNRTINHPRGIR